MAVTTNSNQVVHDCALFRMLPTSAWIEDWSAVEAFCEEQKAAGVEDIMPVLEEDTALVRRLVSSIEMVQVNDAHLRFVGAPNAEILLGPLPEHVFPDRQLRSFITRIDAVWHGDDRVSLTADSPALEGPDIEFEMDWAAPTIDGKIDYSQVVVVLHDISTRVASEKQAAYHIGRLMQLLDMGRGMATTYDTDLIMQLLLITTLDLLGAEQSVLVLTEGDEVTSVMGEGFQREIVQLWKSDLVMQGLVGDALRRRQGVLSDDISTDPRNSGGAVEIASRFPDTSAAIAPIIHDEKTLGALIALNGPARPVFEELDLAVLKALAAQAAVAIRNVEFFEELRESRDSLRIANENLQTTQARLLAAQKMEAIGSLAAGIAHEINTPIQFVSDNTTFVRDGIGSLAKVAREQAEFIATLEDDPKHGAAARDLRVEWVKHDCDFLLEEIPEALGETLEGSERVAEIVLAMKEFAHPGSAAKETVDINRVIETTSAISKNEWKYVADLEMELDEDLPTVEGFSGPLGQSLLILLVNSAQAIAESKSYSDAKGTIKITTSHTSEYAEIVVSDNGPGIPPEIVDRIFDPFFTTKSVGKGSGQGLSIAHNVIVEKHDGEIWSEDANPGARFVIRLPLRPSTGNAAAAS